MPNYVFDKFRAVIAKINPNQTLRVSMLGPSGVGKTSLLATMYDRLENVIVHADLQVQPIEEAADVLYEQKIRLERLFSTDGLIPDQKAGIYSTTGWRAFDFRLGRRGKNATLQLEFVDYPGGWIDHEAGPQEKQWVLDLLRESDAILIPIDAPALMERNGLWHDERNRPDFVFKFIQAAYENLRSPRLVILSPIRCERYLNDPDYEADMVEKVQLGYRKLLGHLSFGELKELIAVVIAPVQTLGEIEYHGSPKDRYFPHFRKTQPNAVYSPRDSEQPLRYLMRFAMRLHRDKRQSGYFTLIRNMFKGDEYLIRAANEFATGCKTNSPFAVLQGQEWLDVARRGT
jgi:Double-GTPase 2